MDIETAKNNVMEAVQRGLENYSRVEIEDLFSDLNYSYQQGTFDDFYYKYNALLILYLLENFGISEAIIEDGLSDDYSLVYEYIMTVPMNTNISNRIMLIMDFMWLLTKNSKDQLDKYYVHLLEKLLTVDLHLTDVRFLLNYTPINVKETDVMIVNYAISRGIFFELIELLNLNRIDNNIRLRILNSLPNEDKYNIYKLGINI